MELERNRGIDALGTGGLLPSPLYKEVKSRLTRGLAAGEWKAGAAIPSESRLAGRFGVSIGTVRKAIDELVAERILLRHQGRGTFVATHTEDRTLFYFFHIVGKDGSRELPVIELLSFRRAKAAAVEAERLLIARGAPIYRIRNVLKLGRDAVLFDEIAVSDGLFSDLDEETFRTREGGARIPPSGAGRVLDPQGHGRPQLLVRGATIWRQLDADDCLPLSQR